MTIELPSSAIAGLETVTIFRTSPSSIFWASAHAEPCARRAKKAYDEAEAKTVRSEFSTSLMRGTPKHFQPANAARLELENLTKRVSRTLEASTDSQQYRGSLDPPILLEGDPTRAQALAAECINRRGWRLRSDACEHESACLILRRRKLPLSCTVRIRWSSCT